MNIQVKLKYKKTTKRTHVFDNDDPDTPVSSIYIKRSVFSDDLPKELILTLTEKVD